MTATLHPYPAYKPSGVPWLGDVPEHWDINRGKALLFPQDGHRFEGQGRRRIDDRLPSMHGVIASKEPRRTDGIHQSL